MSDQVICRMLIAKDRAELDTKIARAAALAMRVKAMNAILACMAGGENKEWMEGLQAAFEAVAVLPLPGNAP
jgi:hypothetical protein